MLNLLIAFIPETIQQYQLQLVEAVNSWIGNDGLDRLKLFTPGVITGDVLLHFTYLKQLPGSDLLVKLASDSHMFAHIHRSFAELRIYFDKLFHIFDRFTSSSLFVLDAILLHIF